MVKKTKRNIGLLLLALMLTAFVAGCSSKGVRMPKHRKRRHCDCPTFAEKFDDGTRNCCQI